MALVTASGVRASENDAVTLKVSIPDLNTSAEHVGIAVYQAKSRKYRERQINLSGFLRLMILGLLLKNLDTRRQCKRNSRKTCAGSSEKRDSFQKCNDRPVRNCSVCRAEAGRLSDHTDVRQETYGKIQNTLIFLPYTDESGMEIFYGEAMVKAEKPECPNHLPPLFPGDSYSCGKIQAAEMSRLITMAPEIRLFIKRLPEQETPHRYFLVLILLIAKIRSSGGSWNHNL